MNKLESLQESLQGKGHLGVILMHALNQDYQSAQESVDYIEAYCKRHGYKITVEQLQQLAANRTY